MRGRKPQASRIFAHRSIQEHVHQQVVMPVKTLSTGLRHILPNNAIHQLLARVLCQGFSVRTPIENEIIVNERQFIWQSLAAGENSPAIERHERSIIQIVKNKE